MTTWMTTLTDKKIQQAISDAKASGKTVCLTDGSTKGWGRLRLRINGTDKFLIYFRYVNSAHEQKDYALGTYTIDTWRKVLERAGELSDDYHDGHRDLHQYLEQLEAEKKQAEEDAKRQREEAERQDASGSLEALLNAYIGHLQEKGKQSAGDAGGIFKRHVFTAFPDTAIKPAREVTHQEINAMLARLIKEGKGRTAAKLRSYLSAAYTLAMEAQTETNPTLTNPNLMGFCLTDNPVAKIKAKSLAEYNRARERALNDSELGAFLKQLEMKPGTVADAIELLLLLGGQRVTQLLRVTPADVDLAERKITLLDPKGKRAKARTHVVPLTERAAALVARHMEGPFLFTTDGKVAVRGETLSNAVARISDGMVRNLVKADLVKAGKADITDDMVETAMKADKYKDKAFQLCDLRRTCETMLAGLKVSMDVRAQLLSHGLSGVQIRHYDKYDYMKDKREALEIWDQHLKSIIR